MEVVVEEMLKQRNAQVIQTKLFSIVLMVLLGMKPATIVLKLIKMEKEMYNQRTAISLEIMTIRGGISFLIKESPTRGLGSRLIKLKMISPTDA